MNLSVYLLLASCLATKYFVDANNEPATCNPEKLPTNMNPTLKKLMIFDLAAGECYGVDEPFDSISLYSNRNRILHFARVYNPSEPTIVFCAADFQYSDYHVKFHSRIFACFDPDHETNFEFYGVMFLNWLDSMGQCDDSCDFGATKEEYVRQFASEIELGLHQGYWNSLGYQMNAYTNRIIFWAKSIRERTVTFEFFEVIQDNVSIYGLNMTQTHGYIYPILELEILTSEGLEGDDTLPMKSTLRIPWLNAVATYNTSFEDGDHALTKTLLDLWIDGKLVLDASDYYYYFKLLWTTYGEDQLTPKIYDVDFLKLPSGEIYETDLETRNESFHLSTGNNVFTIHGLVTEKVNNKIYKEHRIGRQDHISILRAFVEVFDSPMLSNNLTAVKEFTVGGFEYVLNWKWPATSFRWINYIPNPYYVGPFNDPVRMKFQGTMDFVMPLDFLLSSFTIGYGFDEHNFFRLAIDFPTSEDRLHFTIKTRLLKKTVVNEWKFHMYRGNIWGKVEDHELLKFELNRWKNGAKPYKLSDVTCLIKADRQHLVKYMSLFLSSLKEAKKYFEANGLLNEISKIFKYTFGQKFSTLANRAPPPLHSFASMVNTFLSNIGINLIADFDSYPEIIERVESMLKKFIFSFNEEVKFKNGYYVYRFTILDFLRELQKKVILVLTTLFPVLDVENVSSFLRIVKYDWMEDFENWLLEVEE